MIISIRSVQVLFVSLALLFGLGLAGTFGAHADAASPRVFRDCSDCPEMVRLDGGTFMMGAAAEDADAYPEEQPRHRVTIRPFAASKFEITRAQWAAFSSATHRPTRRGCNYSGRTMQDVDPAAAWDTLGFAQDDRHPVVCVSWQDARDYAAWLSERTGKHYRLLSEAEWEYAARAGTTTLYPWGDIANHDNANYGTDQCCGAAVSGADRWQYTAPVGSFPANAFGLHDMNGNVLEWVQDCFAPNFSSTPTDGSANLTDVTLTMTGDLAVMNGQSSCSFRMLRGGDWGSPPRQLRSVSRNWAPTPGMALSDFRSGGIGIRLARDLH